MASENDISSPLLFKALNDQAKDQMTYESDSKNDEKPLSSLKSSITIKKKGKINSKSAAKSKK